MRYGAKTKAEHLFILTASNKKNIINFQITACLNLDYDI